MVGGTSTCCRSPVGRSPGPAHPSSTSMASICSTYRGMPPAARRIRARVSAPMRRPPGSPPSRLSSRPAAAASASGSSSTVEAFSLPPPHRGRSSRNSGRARGRQEEWRVAAPVGEVLDDVQQSRFGPVHVIQDQHHRPRRPSDSTSRRTAQCVSSASAGVPHSPARGANRSTTRSASGSSGSNERSRARPRSSSEPGSRPAACRNICWSGQKTMSSPYDRHRPDSTVVVAGSPASTSDSSRVLPTPAAPSTVTSWQRRSARLRSRACSRTATSRSRPTNRLVVVARRSDSERPSTSSSRQAGTSAALPFRVSGATRSARAACRASSQVCWPTSTSPGAAACSSRAATLTASPVATVPLLPSVPTTTSPLFTPILVASRTPWSDSRPSFMASRAPCMPDAARRARTASSSCSTGTPNTAITASPTNFSTVPPWASTTPLMAAKYRAITERIASASRRSPSAVDPVTSQKMTVTVLRVSVAGDVTARFAPHSRQNLARSGFSAPHEPQATAMERHSRGNTLREVAPWLKEDGRPADRRGASSLRGGRRHPSGAASAGDRAPAATSHPGRTAADPAQNSHNRAAFSAVRMNLTPCIFTNAKSHGMVKAVITRSNDDRTLSSKFGGDMTRAQLFRLMTALGSFGSLVAVVGAGTKWGFTDGLADRSRRRRGRRGDRPRTQVGMLTDPARSRARGRTGGHGLAAFAVPVPDGRVHPGLRTSLLRPHRPGPGAGAGRLGRRRPAVLPAGAHALRRRAAGHPGAAR